MYRIQGHTRHGDIFYINLNNSKKMNCTKKFMVLLVMLGALVNFGCQNSLHPYLNWQGQRSTQSFCVLEKNGLENIDEIGVVHYIDNLVQFNTAGIINKVYKNSFLSDEEMSTNMKNMIVPGTEAYIVELEGSEWLVVEGFFGEDLCQWYFGGWIDIIDN